MLASAQSSENKIELFTGQQPYILQSFIIPGTLSVTSGDSLLHESDYRYDPRSNHLWVPSVLHTDTVTVNYRIWDLDLSERYVRVTDVPISIDTVSISAPIEATTPLTTTQLRRSGSITRGIIAGNNRDARIESGLRLQMSGELSPGIQVRAALTDENTPILPEGTTQRLSELDRVFIEIDTPYSSARLGDFQYQLDQSIFAQINRKIQGIGISVPLPLGGFSGTLKGAAATSRGLFKTQDLNVIDGVQGPYRLQGNANEPFILVIPGSESVYLDGVRLQRGESYDYVIDYATGEIMFTTNRLIKFHHRVAVEFQYRTTEFTRTLASTEVAVSTKTHQQRPPLASLAVTFIREADGKSFDQEFGLTDSDRLLLEQLGDKDATRSSATPVSYDPDAPWIHYTQRDTSIAGNSYSIYVPITDASERNVYRVQFTRVGFNQGDYVRQGEVTNGIVYSYRGPNQGEYLPIRVLPKPSQQRMIDLVGSFSPVRYVEIMGEWANSYRDENRFSSLDAADNHAHSYRGSLKLYELPLGIGRGGIKLDRRVTGQNFATFDRTQPIEFVRSWNLPIDRSLLQSNRETIDELNISWEFSDKSEISGTVGRLHQETVFKGNRRQFNLVVDEPNIPQLDYQFNYIESDSDSVRGQWIRHELLTSTSLIQQQLNISTRFKTSQCHQQIPLGLRQDSRQFWEISPLIEFKRGRSVISAGFDWREEHLWMSDYILLPGRRTATTSLNYSTRPGGVFQSEGRVGIQFTDHSNFFETYQGLTDERSLVMRWSGRAHPWDRLLRVNWHYEALSEQTPVLQEIYIRTGPELGEYVWIDSNQNGILEIDEFIPEVSQDEGEYARTLIPSDSLESVTGLKARLNLHFDGGQHWRNPINSWQKWLRHLALRTGIDIQEKSKNPDPINIYLLRQGKFRDPVNSIRGTLNLVQDLWLLRNNPRYGLHASWRHVRSTNVFAADTEMRSIDEWRTQLRWSIGDAWAFTSEGKFSEKQSKSSAFSSREFDIRTQSFLQEAQVSVTSNIRVSSGLDYSRKNAEDRGDATIIKFPIQSSWERAGRANMSLRVEFASITLSQQSKSSGLALFELTDGRGGGRSLLWHMNGWLQLSKVLRATLTYSGRNPSDAPQIHTVRMQLSATF
ncbi:MAG: hypothetical protein OXE59_03020 [Bacteroidetes bacterium]|nr:hypothetical protein [Bacteroidota bacterium]